MYVYFLCMFIYLFLCMYFKYVSLASKFISKRDRTISHTFNSYAVKLYARGYAASITEDTSLYMGEYNQCIPPPPPVDSAAYTATHIHI